MTTVTNTQVNIILNFLRCATPDGSVVDRNVDTIQIDFANEHDERWFLKSAAHALIESFAFECGNHFALHLYYYFNVEGE